MQTEQLEQTPVPIAREALMSLVGALVGRSRGGREDDEHPLPPGPWDPVIRLALERSAILGPQPEPWKVILASLLNRHPEIRDAIGAGRNPLDLVALNPQPLPPRYAFMMSLAQTVIARATLFQEFADAASLNGEQRGIIIVGGYTSQFCDDLCPPPFRLPWPFPGPRPKWYSEELDGVDLMLLAMEFEMSARETFSPSLRQNLSAAAARFAEAGLSRLQ